MNDSIPANIFNLPIQTLLNESELTSSSGNNTSINQKTSRNSTTQPNIERLLQQEHRHSTDSGSSSKGSVPSVLTPGSKKKCLDSLTDLSINSNQADILIQKNFQLPDSDSVIG